jgi:hypothetical protein
LRRLSHPKDEVRHYALKRMQDWRRRWESAGTARHANSGFHETTAIAFDVETSATIIICPPFL